MSVFESRSSWGLEKSYARLCGAEGHALEYSHTDNQALAIDLAIR